MSAPTAVTHVTVSLGDDDRCTASANDSDGYNADEGSVFFNGIRLQFAGTPSQLRTFAKAIEDGAMEIERQIAEARRSQPREQAVPCTVCTTPGPDGPLVRHTTFNLDRIHDACRDANVAERGHTFAAAGGIKDAERDEATV